MSEVNLIVTQAIQAILSPAVMISSSALFFLALNARQGAVLNRIRSLNEEKRKLIKEISHNTEHDYSDDIRCLNIDNQINVLLRRAWYVRNAIIFHALAVVFFVLTSIALSISFILGINLIYQVPILLFIIGILLVLAGVISMSIDEIISYSVILIEVATHLSRNKIDNLDNYHE